MSSVRRRAVPGAGLGALFAAQIACLAPLSGGALHGQVEGIHRQLEAIASQQKSNREAVSALEPPAPPPAPDRFDGAEVPGVAAPPAGEPRGATGGETLYREGYTLYHRGDLEAAERALRSFVRAHPASPLAGNARYWIGETLFARGRYAGAIEEFRAAIERQPAGGEAAPALYKIALCRLALGETSGARAALEELLEKFPESDVAPLARERLRGL